jgi:cleavage and polyadenylation specificity factor subunit 3
MVSDSVVAVVLNIVREGPKVVPVEEAAKTKEDAERVALKVVYSLMASLFGDVKVGEEGKFIISVDGDVAHLDGTSGDVECENATLKGRIKTAFCRIQGAVTPIPLLAS